MKSLPWPVFIDTDIGDDIDDALALALAVRSPEIHLLGVSTVFGETQKRARLAAHLLRVYEQSEVPVAAGCAEPLQRRHRSSGVPQAALLDSRVHYNLSEQDGPDLLISTAHTHPGQLIVLCLGPLTNIATALQREPGLTNQIARIILMGGTSGLPLPEWNVRSDVLAARQVLTSGIPITLIGLNITRRCMMSEQDLLRLRAEQSPRTRLLWQLTSIWQRHRPRWHPARPYLHDPLTIVALCAPHLFTFTTLTERIITQGPLTGLMLPRLFGGPVVRAATAIQAGAARSWIMQRLSE
jgi:inosine-uridine nucleoside N-ribohydrolase